MKPKMISFHNCVISYYVHIYMKRLPIFGRYGSFNFVSHWFMDRDFSSVWKTSLFFSCPLKHILFPTLVLPWKKTKRNSPPFNLKVSWMKNPLAFYKVGPYNMWEMVVTWMLVCNALYKMLFAPQMSIVWEIWCNTKQLANDFSKEDQLGLYKKKAFRPWCNHAHLPISHEESI